MFLFKFMQEPNYASKIVKSYVIDDPDPIFMRSSIKMNSSPKSYRLIKAQTCNLTEQWRTDPNLKLNMQGQKTLTFIS